MALVAGVDSSTQACKVVVCDALTGEVVRSGAAPHPVGTEVDPAQWLRAFEQASMRAGGLQDVSALSVGAQQHGMVCIEEAGRVVRPALLWNDVRSAPQAAALVREFGGGQRGARFWAEAVGSVPVASFTVTKLRWLAENEPRSAAATAAVCLPHDWLTWMIGGGRRLEDLVTDRGDASGTGYFSPVTGAYRLDLLTHAFGRVVQLPSVSGPAAASLTARGVRLGCGTGDNAAAALGVAAEVGDMIVSIGTSGTAYAVSDTPTADETGTVAGFADATGRFLPLAATLNAARVLTATASLLGVEDDELSRLALSAPAGAGGLVLVPYLEGERTPNLPFATGALHGVRLDNWTPAHVARAAIEGVLCGLAAGFDAVVAQGVRAERVILVGGAARSKAVRRLAPSILGRAVVVPSPSEYVAIGAARQAAWTLAGGKDPPAWRVDGRRYDGDPAESLRARYAEAAEMTLGRSIGER